MRITIRGLRMRRRESVNAIDEQVSREIVQNFRAQLEAMVAGDTVQLAHLLTGAFTLTHTSGYVQAKSEWMQQIEDGVFDYQDAEEVCTSVHTDGDNSVLTSDVVVRATVYGDHDAWPLRFTVDFTCVGGAWLASRSTVTTF
ncbi:conserved hypothetical protein [Kineococcus radiotolerans SRS30216 = ATCC BAA-149]|uniref:DUF4440 domain-containing protein n=1 Tax=Kineococcus radiotolerans (strain ATCC BAA-149 / DSM 14245 / SRS30216) TaxID=266940 RepID=A6WA45_KINRD|nr:conserved hypothetical protein [Kineococcus radiotolerans SRS30216 = ATCC BAA-149]